MGSVTSSARQIKGSSLSGFTGGRMAYTLVLDSSGYVRHWDKFLKWLELKQFKESLGEEPWPNSEYINCWVYTAWRYSKKRIWPTKLGLTQGWYYQTLNTTNGIYF